MGLILAQIRELLVQSQMSVYGSEKAIIWKVEMEMEMEVEVELGLFVSESGHLRTAPP